MEMINFDEHKEKPTKHHYLLPDCHNIMIGQTGCGKTNTLCNIGHPLYNKPSTTKISTS